MDSLSKLTKMTVVVGVQYTTVYMKMKKTCMAAYESFASHFGFYFSYPTLATKNISLFTGETKCFKLLH